MTLLTLWFACGATPTFAAAPAAPALPTGWSAARYNEALHNIAAEVDPRGLPAVVALLASPEGVHTLAGSNDAVVSLFEDRRAQLAALPEWPNAAAYRARVQAMVEFDQDFWTQTLPEVQALQADLDPEAADVARLNAIACELGAQSASIATATRSAAQDFASHNPGVAVLPDSGPVGPLAALAVADVRASLLVPGLPPTGSCLTAAEHVSFALRYYNHVVSHQVATMEALNSFFTAWRVDSHTAGAAQKAALEAVEQRRARVQAEAGDWQGDPTLRAGLDAFMSRARSLLSGPAAQMALIASQRTLSTRDVEMARTMYAQANSTLALGVTGFKLADEQFRKSAGIDAWVQQPR